MSTFDDLTVRKIYLDLSEARNNVKEPIAFTHMRVADVSSNTALATMRFQSMLNKDIEIFEGRRFKNWPTNQVFFSNDAQAGEWIMLEYWGGPAYGAPEIIDSALTASLNGGTIDTLKDILAGKIDEVVQCTQLEALLKNNQQLRAPLTDLVNATFGEAVNASTVLVSAATNVNGIIVRRGLCNQGGSTAGTSYIAADDGTKKYICHVLTSGSNNAVVDAIENYLVPAGHALEISSNASSGRAAAWYEVL